MKKTYRVAVLIEPNRAYEMGLIRGIINYSNNKKSWIFFRLTPFYRQNDNSNLLNQLKKWKPDGIILRENKLMPSLISLNIPIIISNYLQEKINKPIFSVDNNLVGKMAAEYFITKGYKNFGFCGFDDHFWSENRKKSFIKVISKYNYLVNCYKSPLNKNKILWEDEPLFIANWLKTLRLPCAIFACTDERAEQIIEAAKIAKLKIPEQLAVLGVDNDEYICNLTNPPLSSIHINTELCGYKAASVLNKMMQNKNFKAPSIINVKPKEVITRKSTNIFAVNDIQIQKALLFINENAGIKSLKVTDVVNNTALSRRTLENRFRSLLNRSVLEEITRVRIQRLSELLIDTNYTISEISIKMGFLSVQNVSRYFKKIIKKTPLEFRNSISKIK